MASTNLSFDDSVFDTLLLVLWINNRPRLYLERHGRLWRLWGGVVRQLPFDSFTRRRIEGRWNPEPDSDDNDTN